MSVFEQYFPRTVYKLSFFLLGINNIHMYTPCFLNKAGAMLTPARSRPPAALRQSRRS